MKRNFIYISLILLLGVVLYLFSWSNYLFFHLTIEFLTITFGILIFTLSIITKDFKQSSFLVTLGPGILTVSLIAFIHMATYKGMNIVHGYDANLPTQLWIVLNYILSFSILVAIWRKNKKVKFGVSTTIYLCIGILATVLCFAGIFPACFVEGVGLTVFKKVSEYIIIFIYLLCMVLIYRKKDILDRKNYKVMLLIITLFMLSEFMFTLYTDVYGIQNFLGHYLRLLAFLVLYIFIVIDTIQKPFNSIFSELYDLATKDGLTGLYNHRSFIKEVEKFISLTSRSGKNLYLIILDVDKFKTINDIYGHLTGDHVLTEMAKIIKSNIRDSDMAFRQGGDEFSIILYDIEQDSVEIIIKRLKKEFNALELIDQKIKLTVSGGITKYGNESSKEFIKKADQLLYNAKENGRNRINFSLL